MQIIETQDSRPSGKSFDWNVNGACTVYGNWSTDNNVTSLRNQNEYQADDVPIFLLSLARKKKTEHSCNVFTFIKSIQ